MPTALEKKTKQQFKNCRKTVPVIASEFEKSVISVTFGLFCKNSEYHLQTSQVTAKPIARGFGLSPKEISLTLQNFLKYREAIDALNHNIRFIIFVNKLNSTLPVRNKNTQEHVETLIDLDFIQKNISFEHNLKTLLHNTQNKDLQIIYTSEDFDRKAIEVLKTSKTLIETLETLVSKQYLTDEVNELKEASLKRADTFIDALQTGKISLSPLQEALKAQKPEQTQHQ